MMISGSISALVPPDNTQLYLLLSKHRCSVLQQCIKLQKKVLQCDRIREDVIQICLHRPGRCLLPADELCCLDTSVVLDISGGGGSLKLCRLITSIVLDI